MENLGKPGGLIIGFKPRVVKPGQKTKIMLKKPLLEDLASIDINFVFQGIEVVTFESSDENNNKITIVKSSYVCKDNYIRRINFLEYPGKSTFKFYFYIPTGIPGTFNYGNASVRYHLEFFCEVKGVAFSLKTEIKVKDTQILDHLFSVTETIPSYTCCCLIKRLVTMNIIWINDTYRKNENLECILEVDNTQSSIDFKSVTANIFISAHFISAATINSFNKIDLLNCEYYIPIKKGKKLTGQNGGQFTFDLSKFDSILNTDYAYSYRSKLIDFKFYVSFQLNTRFFNCKSGFNISTLFYVTSSLLRSNTVLSESYDERQQGPNAPALKNDDFDLRSKEFEEKIERETLTGDQN